MFCPNGEQFEWIPTNLRFVWVNSESVVSLCVSKNHLYRISKVKRHTYTHTLCIRLRNHCLLKWFGVQIKRMIHIHEYEWHKQLPSNWAQFVFSFVLFLFKQSSLLVLIKNWCIEIHRESFNCQRLSNHNFHGGLLCVLRHTWQVTVQQNT